MVYIIVQCLVFSVVVLVTLSCQNSVERARDRAGSRAGLRIRKSGVLTRESRKLGGRLEPVMGRWCPQQLAQIKQQLATADLSATSCPKVIIGQQIIAGLVAGILSALAVFALAHHALGTAAAGCVGGVIGFLLPSVHLSSKAKKRQDTIARELPYAIDLLTVAMQAGQDFGAAMKFLVHEGPAGVLSQELGVVLHEVSLGKTRVEALRAMADRIQISEFNALVNAVAQSAEVGASLSATLAIQSEELRRRRRHRAERKAARAPSLMIIPVALFILPAVFIVILVPVAIKILAVLP